MGGQRAPPPIAAPSGRLASRTDASRVSAVPAMDVSHSRAMALWGAPGGSLWQPRCGRTGLGDAEASFSGRALPPAAPFSARLWGQQRPPRLAGAVQGRAPPTPPPSGPRGSRANRRRRSGPLSQALGPDDAARDRATGLVSRPVRTWDERQAAADAWPLLPLSTGRTGRVPEPGRFPTTPSVLELVSETVSSLGEEIESRWRQAARGEWQPGGCTPHSYLDVALRPRDAEGYAAAGVVPYIVRPGEPGPRILLARQGEGKRRGGSSALVLLGGKREGADACAASTASREAEEETGGLLNALLMRALIAPVLWFPSGRFAAFLCRMDSDALPRAFEALPRKPRFREVESLHWVRLEDATLRPRELRVHPFCYGVLRSYQVRDFLAAQQTRADAAVASAAVAAARAAAAAPPGSPPPFSPWSGPDSPLGMPSSPVMGSPGGSSSDVVFGAAAAPPAAAGSPMIARTAWGGGEIELLPQAVRAGGGSNEAPSPTAAAVGQDPRRMQVALDILRQLK